MSITQTEKELPCNCCGETGRIKARATRKHQQLFGAEFIERRLFCHDEEKSCYVFMRGRYFEDVDA